MCTMIVTQVNIEGSGKAASGWFKLREANVSYDHPFDAPFEHALNIDFVNEALGPSARVAVELSVEAARTLIEAIGAVLERAEAGGYVEAVVSRDPDAAEAAMRGHLANTVETLHTLAGSRRPLLR